MGRAVVRPGEIETVPSASALDPHVVVYLPGRGQTLSRAVHGSRPGRLGDSPGRYDRSLPNMRKRNDVIDRLREQIQHRLDQLAGEADRLRKALAALAPRSSTSPARKPAARKRAQTAAPKPKASATKSAPPRRTRQPATPSPRRTAPGATKASVLAALAGGEAMTAGQVADKTGLARPTVSTTLSKLAKSGEVQKAERGYQLAAAAPATLSSPSQ
jgi:DNA-binding transcriptional ArsR family regulator